MPPSTVGVAAGGNFAAELLPRLPFTSLFRRCEAEQLPLLDRSRAVMARVKPWRAAERAREDWRNTQENKAEEKKQQREREEQQRKRLAQFRSLPLRVQRNRFRPLPPFYSLL